MTGREAPWQISTPSLSSQAGLDSLAAVQLRNVIGDRFGVRLSATAVIDHPTVAALAVATVPLFTLLCGYFWGARNTRLEWAGVILGIIGIAMLNMGSTLQSSPIGAALLLFAAASWAFGSVWSRHLPLRAWLARPARALTATASAAVPIARCGLLTPTT